MPLDDETPEASNNPKPVEQSAAGRHASDQKDVIAAAHDEAEKDIEQDAELSFDPRPEDDLDEGELARFEDGDDIEPKKEDDGL